MKNKLIMNLKEHTLEGRILIIAAAIGLIASMLTSIMNIFLDIGMMIVIITLGASVVAVTVIYFAYVKRKFMFPAYFGIITMMLIMYPLMWIYNGGSRGPTILFMLFNATFCAVLLSRLKYRLVLTLQILVFYLLLTWEYMFPSNIVPYKTELARSIDYAFSFTLVFIISFIVVVRILKEYNKNIKELESTHSELKTINQKLKRISETDELTDI